MPVGISHEAEKAASWEAIVGLVVTGQAALEGRMFAVPAGQTYGLVLDGEVPSRLAVGQTIVAPKEGPGHVTTGHVKIVRARHEVASRVVPEAKGCRESSRVSG